MSEEENVVHGPIVPLPPILCSTGTFLYERLLEIEDPSIPLFLNGGTGKSITAYELLEKSCHLADSLTNFGLTPKNIAAICSENNVEFFIPVVACLCAGVPLAPISPMYTDSEYNHTLDLIEPDVIFCSAKTAQKMISIKSRRPKVKLIIVINSDEVYSDAWPLAKFIGAHSKLTDIYKYKAVEVDIENHPAFIMFSSGTTGLPKGVIITHKNVNVKNNLMVTFAFDVEPTGMVIIPFFHAAGLHGAMHGLLHGQTIVFLEKFELDLYLKCVEKYKIRDLLAVPLIMQIYAKSSSIDKYDLSHVQNIMCGTGSVSETLEKTVKKRMSAKVRQGYGMTEATVILTTVPPSEEKPGSIGMLLPNLTAVVRDVETGRNLGPKQPGELCFKGGVIMKGYYKNDAANKEIFTEDGYMRTGDIGYYDEEGYFYIVDRLKELIKYKSFQVAPAELEAVLMTNPNIMDAAVVGVPDEDVGELPMAFVVKKPDVTLTELQVQQYVQKHVSPIKYLRGGVVFVTEIPRTTTGKILRKELKKVVNEYKSKL